MPRLSVTLPLALSALRRGGCVAVLLALSACDSIYVAEDLSQKQARQVVAALNQNGIGAVAERQSGGGAKYSVEISKKNYARATAVLSEKNLPTEERASFEDLTSQSGLLPRSREMESLALDRALAVQLEELLLQNPRVRSSKVVVRLNYLPEKSEPSASIAVIGEGIDGTEVLSMAQRVVPGITPARISLALHKDESEKPSHRQESGREMSSFLFGVARVPDEDYIVLAFTFIGSLITVAFAGGLVGYWYGLLNRGGMAQESRVTDRSSKPIKLDKPKRDLTEL